MFVGRFLWHGLANIPQFGDAISFDSEDVND